VKQKFLLFLKLVLNSASRLSDAVQKRRWLQIAINLLLVAFLIAFFARYLQRDWLLILKEDITLSIWPLIVSIAIYGANHLVFIFAWNSLVTRFGGQFTFSQNVFNYSYSALARFLPTPAWFLASRVYLYGRNGIRKRTALIATGLETLLHIATGLGFYCVLQIDSSKPASFLYLLGVTPVLLAIYKPDWLEMRWIHQGKIEPGPRRIDVLFWISLYLVTWLISAPFFAFIIQTFTLVTPIDLVHLWRIWIISSIIAYIGSYTLGGIAVIREFSITILLSQFYSPPVALLITIGSRLIMTIAGIIWSLVTLGIAQAWNWISKKQQKELETGRNP
jgi:hypothetical protein